MKAPPDAAVRGDVSSARRRRRTAWWRLGAGAVLLGALLAVVGPSEIVRVARRVRPGWALTAAAVAGSWLLLGALNVWVLLRRLAPVGLTDFVGVYVTSWSAAMAIPGQLGDATQILLLRGHGVPPSRSGAAYAVDKVVSLSWLAAVALLGVSLYLPDVPGEWILVPAAAGAVAVVLLLIVALRLRAREGSLLERAQGALQSLLAQIRAFRSFPWTVTLNVTLTGVKWATNGVMYMALFRAFDVPIPFLPAAVIPVMASLVGYIPVTVGGAGTTEWTAVALYGGLGVDPATVTVVYLLMRIVLILCALLLLMSARSSPTTGDESSAS